MDKKIILDYLAKNKEIFKEKYGVTKIGLFGSYVRNEQRDDSDIDIAVEMIEEKKTLRTFFGFKQEVELAFGKKVDLGIESTLKPIAKEYILKEIIYV
ncbi:nucleotidyltransferase family protein [Sulfurospirillum multivorans]|uniref:DNA polymerase, beta domain protein n=2 Tax=Sulfurospirillum multivorans TaxID=66821 RepID=A0AA86AJK0_SULMK|nr:nucleotidyltransferase [Sulfurospirillum multivorans]AHJ11900.1 DNA polymerase, beta domain protein [Sulfurospirillum multivorans DSM 12446]QEH05406.1 DNA polymerase, beta domain protein [Sulfurospirillum multivorans]